MYFSLGVTYWPRSSGTRMWRHFDAGEIAADFAHMAALGFDTVRVYVRWDDFAPAPDRLDPVMLERLETLLERARDAGLGVMPVLYCGHFAGITYLPEWMLGKAPSSGRFRTFVNDRETARGAADLYGEALRAPQLFFARTIGARFAQHPAIRAWDIGAPSNVREPAPGKRSTGGHSSEPVAERALAAWSAAIVSALRETSSLPVTASTPTDDLASDRNVRLGSFCTPFTFASLHGLTVSNPFARNRLDPEAMPFFAMLAAAFSFKPVLVTGFGNPACPPQKYSAFERFAPAGAPPDVTISPHDSVFATYPCASDEENATHATAVLERLHADGRLGAYWWSWADYGEALREQPPFDLAPHEAACGVVRADGTEKPLAAALTAFARERRLVTSSKDMPMIAAAYYYRTLPKSATTLYDAFLRFTSERRAILN